MPDWEPLETSTHQHHVVAHVVGATALGYFEADDALHFLLDLGLVWTIYLDAEMGLVPESLALSELNLPAEERRELAEDARALHAGAAREGSRVRPAPHGLLIEEVELYGRDEGRRLLLRGEGVRLSIETSLADGTFRVEAFG
ncbi:MAG TPA: hypothetical protein VGV38_15635 [Pyrinomonadaceae bacterium]|nr:hypothetical protein [Pyrinomonadaceae bacterium]